MDRKDPFDRAPFLFPWYVHGHNPKLVYHERQLEWHRVEYIDEEFVGLTTLQYGDQVYAAFRIYNNLLTSDTGDRFCVWQQEIIDGKSDDQIRISVFETNKLEPIKLPSKKLLEFHHDSERQFLIESQSIAEVDVPISRASSCQVQFPVEFHSFGNFIMVVRVEDLYDEPTGGNTALAEIFPFENRVSMYPQDWFNKDERIDFGYQWITRAIRPLPAGGIQGQGIRIDDFELDETNRQIKN